MSLVPVHCPVCGKDVSQGCACQATPDPEGHAREPTHVADCTCDDGDGWDPRCPPPTRCCHGNDETCTMCPDEPGNRLMYQRRYGGPNWMSPVRVPEPEDDAQERWQEHVRKLKIIVGHLSVGDNTERAYSNYVQDVCDALAVFARPAPSDDFERARSADWRHSLDDNGVPTCGPARADYGCQYCYGPLDAKSGVGQYECPWCIARFPRSVLVDLQVSGSRYPHCPDVEPAASDTPAISCGDHSPSPEIVARMVEEVTRPDTAGAVQERLDRALARLKCGEHLSLKDRRLLTEALARPDAAERAEVVGSDLDGTMAGQYGADVCRFVDKLIAKARHDLGWMRMAERRPFYEELCQILKVVQEPGAIAIGSVRSIASRSRMLWREAVADAVQALAKEACAQLDEDAVKEINGRGRARILAALVAERQWSLPEDIRQLGWTVAVHNDYRSYGKSHTFWLFTKDGRAVKGEGRNDAAALDCVRVAIAEQEGEKS